MKVLHCSLLWVATLLLPSAATAETIEGDLNVRWEPAGYLLEHGDRKSAWWRKNVARDRAVGKRIRPAIRAGYEEVELGFLYVQGSERGWNLFTDGEAHWILETLVTRTPGARVSLEGHTESGRFVVRRVLSHSRKAVRGVVVESVRPSGLGLRIGGRSIPLNARGLGGVLSQRTPETPVQLRGVAGISSRSQVSSFVVTSVRARVSRLSVVRVTPRADPITIQGVLREGTEVWVQAEFRGFYLVSAPDSRWRKKGANWVSRNGVSLLAVRLPRERTGARGALDSAMGGQEGLARQPPEGFPPSND